MMGEEASGLAASNSLRLLCFAGAGLICAVAVHRWRHQERKAMERKQRRHQQLLNNNQPQHSSASSALDKSLD